MPALSPARVPFRLPLPAAAGLACGLALSVGPVLAAGSADAGLALSRQHCARCHIVSTDNRFAGISSTPSFKIMIEALQDWEVRFETFLARNPHPAHIRLKGDDPRPDNLPSTLHEVLLTHDDIEAILAYVRSLAASLGRN